MKKMVIVSIIVVCFSSVKAQFKLYTKVIDATKNAAKAVTFTDADAPAL
ncbi:MAG TPA: hypothetical protein VM884_07875 [Flavisolibacter sp.]|nr:hypothetical protein [Flavisolibacter sp.]